eukprot:COSAG01_NODE_1247_length_11073_cov_23.273465_2_plen_135_part_00
MSNPIIFTRTRITGDEGHWPAAWHGRYELSFGHAGRAFRTEVSDSGARSLLFTPLPGVVLELLERAGQEVGTPSLVRAILAGIHLCHACSCHEISSMETARQGAEWELVLVAGATGRTGARLYAQLREVGVRVR